MGPNGNRVIWSWSDFTFRYPDGEKFLSMSKEYEPISNPVYRPCPKYQKLPVEHQDACIANLPNVVAACCGHGIIDDAYVIFSDGRELRGERARLYFNKERS